jgi:hypothetical protein
MGHQGTSSIVHITINVGFICIFGEKRMEEWRNGGMEESWLTANRLTGYPGSNLSVAHYTLYSVICN